MKFVLLPPTVGAVPRLEGGARSGFITRLLNSHAVPAGRLPTAVRRDVRWMSSMYEAHAEASLDAGARRSARGERGKGRREAKSLAPGPSSMKRRGEAVGRKTFEELGLDKKFVDAIRKAFPNVERPTRVQEELIGELVKGQKDILLKDDTGSGKTFGMVLGLLSKPRRVVYDEEKGEKRRVVTTLFVVPHRDLAVQIMGWIERLWEGLKPDVPPLESIAQMLVRGKGWDRKKAAEMLRETAPHMVVCTPQALKDMVEEDAEALGLETLSAVVVDEVDYVIPMVEKKGRRHRHEGETRVVLEKIYGGRRKMREKSMETEKLEEWRRARDEMEKEMPQLVMSSATLRVHFEKYLFEESGLMNGHKTVKIRGEGVGEKQGRVLHSILVATRDGVVNADGDGAREIEFEDAEGEEAPFDDRNALEAIAAAVTHDVSVEAAALLVIPSSSPVQRVVEELRALGLDAEGLDLDRRKESPQSSSGARVLVATAATTRGIDLAELSHVFVVGVPEGRAVEGYRHIAGRVGRFGGSGRVVSVVSAGERERMGRVLSSIGAELVRLELFN